MGDGKLYSGCWPKEGVCPRVHCEPLLRWRVGKGVSIHTDARALSGGQSQGLGSHGNFASLTLALAPGLSFYPEINPPHPFFLWRGCWLSGTPLWKNRIPRKRPLPSSVNITDARSQTEDMGTTALPSW